MTLRRPFSFFRRQRGATGTEYGLLVGLIAVGMMVAVGQTGGSISSLFQYIVDALLGKRIELSGNTVAENAGVVVVGTLSYKGTDAAAVGMTYVTTDSRFTIEDTTLKTAVSFDYETTPTVTVPVSVTTASDQTFTQNVTVIITDVNESPTLLSVAPTLLAVAEDAPVGTLVATLSTNDPDFDGVSTYSIVAGNEAGVFQISNNTLTVAGALDYETKTNYALTLRATDSAGHTVDAAVSVTITNVADVPAHVVLDGTAPTFSLTNSSDIDATAGVVYVEKTLTFKNTGELETAVLADATLTPATGSSFTKTDGCTGKILVPSTASSGLKTCTVVIRAAATTNMTLTGATLTVGDSSTALAGTASGLTAVLAFDSANPTTVSNFNTSTGTSDCTALLVKNTGHAVLSAPVTVALSGTQAGYFSVCTPANNGCGASLAIGASCAVGVSAKALVDDSYSATVTASATGVSSVTQNIDLTASGITYATCAAALSRAGTLGLTASTGVYPLKPGATSFSAYCDMTSDGGGWMLAGKVHIATQENVSEPRTWFVDGAGGSDILTPTFTTDHSPSALGVSKYLAAIVDNTTLARFRLYAEDDLSQTATWYKRVKAANIQTWFNGNEATATATCLNLGMTTSCSDAAFAYNMVNGSNALYMLNGMNLSSYGYSAGGAIHLRQNGDESAKFSAVCSWTFNNNNNAWKDGGNGPPDWQHWGNGLLIWIR